MCGIAGIVKLKGAAVQQDTVARMLGWLTHRGPDDQGVWSNGQVALGTARLAIIDLVTGRQPLCNEDETVWVALNGEIYNFLELRETLRAKGHQFRTRTDTEVIVHAYEEWGEEFVTHLKGMFGFALVDLPRQLFYLARDPVGEKPLFYTHQAQFLAFASELKPLLHECGVSRALDPLAIHSFLAFSRPVKHLCVFKEVDKLLPGQMLRLNMETGAQQVAAYWTLPDEKVAISPEEAERELVRRLEECIQKYIIADVPVGAFLSGGTDSSAVVAMMRRFFDHPVKTFTVIYDDPYLSEAAEARQVAATLNTEHHEIWIGPADVVQALPRLIWHLEEPFADESFLPTYFVSKKAREHVTVALTGDGGDELFGGYDWYLAWRVLESYTRAPERLKAVGAWIGGHLPLQHLAASPRFYRYVSGVQRLLKAAAEPDDIARFQALTGDASLAALLSEPVMTELLNLRRSAVSADEGEDSLDRILRFQFRGLLPELFFTKVDRMSMANSLECRSPLVYRDIVEFAHRLPTSLKIRGTTRKYLLKKAFEQYLPREIIYRPKKGFSLPFYRWLRDVPELRTLVEYYTAGRGSRFLSELQDVNLAYIRNTTREYLEGRHNRWVLGWKAICLGLWWETFVEHDGRAPLASGR
jgi:asparagine synthase (glutamine-hydrolysing)